MAERIIKLPDGTTRTFDSSMSDEAIDAQLRTEWSQKQQTAKPSRVVAFPDGSTHEFAPDASDDDVHATMSQIWSQRQSNPGAVDVPPVKPDIQAIEKKRAMQALIGDGQQRTERPSDRLAFQGLKREADLQRDLAMRTQAAQQQVHGITAQIEKFRRPDGVVDKRAMLDAVNEELANGGQADWFFKWYPANTSLDAMIGDVALEDTQRNMQAGVRGTRAGSAQSRYAPILNRDKQLREQGYSGAIQDIFSDHPSVLPDAEPENEDYQELIRSPLANLKGALSPDANMFNVPLTAGLMFSADDAGKVDILDKKVGPFSEFFNYNLGPKGEIQVSVRKGFESALNDYEKNHPADNFDQTIDFDSLRQVRDGQTFYVNRPGASRQDFTDFLGSIPTQIATAIPAGKIIKGGGLLVSAARGALSGSTGSIFQDIIAKNMGSNEDVSMERAIAGGVGGSLGDMASALRLRPGNLSRRQQEDLISSLFKEDGTPTDQLGKDLLRLNQGLDEESLTALGPQYMGRLRDNLLGTQGDLGQAVRLTDAEDLGVPLTQGQLSRNRLRASTERQAGNGLFGDAKEELVTANTKAQQEALMGAGEKQLNSFGTSLTEHPVDIIENSRGILDRIEKGMRDHKDDVYDRIKMANLSEDNPLVLKGSALYDLRRNISNYLKKKENSTRYISPDSFQALDAVDDVIRDVAEAPGSGISRKMIKDRAPHLPERDIDQLVSDFAYVTKKKTGDRLGDENLRRITREEQNALLKDALKSKGINPTIAPQDIRRIIESIPDEKLKEFAKNFSAPLGVGGKVPNRPVKEYAERTDRFAELVDELTDSAANVQEVSYADLSKIGDRIRQLYRKSEPRSPDRVHLGQIQRMHEDLVENKVSDYVISGDPALIDVQKQARQLYQQYAHVFGKDSIASRLLDKTSSVVESGGKEIRRENFKFNPEEAANAILNLKGMGLKREAGQFIDKMLSLQKLEPNAKGVLNQLKGAIVNNLWRQSLNKVKKQTGEFPVVDGHLFSSNIWKTLGESATPLSKLFNKSEIAEMKKIARLASTIGTPVTNTDNPSGSGKLLEQLMRTFFRTKLGNTIFKFLPDKFGGVSMKSLQFADGPIIRKSRLSNPMIGDVVAGPASVMGTPNPSEQDIRTRRKKSNPDGFSQEFLDELLNQPSLVVP